MSVSTGTAKTVSSIAAMAIGRLRGLFSGFLSVNGSNSNIKKPPAVTTKVATASSRPGKYINSWYKNTKYHSGFGTYKLSVGSAGS